MLRAFFWNYKEILKVEYNYFIYFYHFNRTYIPMKRSDILQYNITYREKDKGWQFIISYKRNNKWKQKSKQGFKTKKDAKKDAEEVLEKLKQTVNLNIPVEFEDITFLEFGKRYITHTSLYREYKTIQSTQTVLNRFSELNELKLSKITPLNIQEVVDNLVKEGLSHNTIKYYLKKLTIIFKSAKDQYRIIDDIPSKNIYVCKQQAINKRALTEKEVNDLLEKFKGTDYYLLVFIAANTGMRLGEILGLTWNNVDLKNNEIKVTMQWKKLKDGTFGFGSLKTKNSNRIIPISKDVSNELKTFKGITNFDNRVFKFVNKNSLITNINRKFKKFGYNISFHELRHTYATKLIANNMDFKTAASILGHNVQQTIKTYSHVNDDMLLKAKSLIENIF